MKIFLFSLLIFFVTVISKLSFAERSTQWCFTLPNNRLICEPTLSMCNHILVVSGSLQTFPNLTCKEFPN